MHTKDPRAELGRVFELLLHRFPLLALSREDVRGHTCRPLRRRRRPPPVPQYATLVYC